jgi:septation ring formation regulator EzrA
MTTEERPLPVSRRRAHEEEGSSNSSAPVYMVPGFQDIERARQEAEARAMASESNYQSLRAQFERAVEHVKTLEAQARSQHQLHQQLRENEARADAAEERVKELQAEVDRMTYAAGSADR